MATTVPEASGRERLELGDARKLLDAVLSG